MIPKRTPSEIEKIEAAGKIVVDTLGLLAGSIQPGVQTVELDAIAERFIRSRGATPSCKGYHGYPASICASPNALVVHGIPGPYQLRDGDIVTIDLAVTYEGWIADAARTFAVGSISAVARDLVKVSESALHAGVERCRAGNRMGDVSHAIQQVTEGAGFSVLKALRGHGVGRRLHEEPLIPNFGKPGTGPLLEPGMVLAIEPMVSAGSSETRMSDDGWAVFAQDGALTAHSEFTVAVTPSECRILTRW